MELSFQARSIEGARELACRLELVRQSLGVYSAISSCDAPYLMSLGPTKRKRGGRVVAES